MSETMERISRRVLLKSGGAAAIGLSLPGVAVARSHRRRVRLQSHLRRSSYTPLVDHVFSVTGGPRRLRLAAVADLNHAQAGSENAFALIFWAAPGRAPLAQAVPTLHHRQLGTFKLFLSPGRPAAPGQTYVAVVNRLHA